MSEDFAHWENEMATHVAETTEPYVAWLEMVLEAKRTGKAVGGFGPQPGPPDDPEDTAEAVEAFRTFRPKAWWLSDDGD